jgi:hypothetical protein
VSAITITRAQREAIYAHLLLDLSAIGDIHIVLNNGDHETAQRYRHQFEDDMRLLDDLGWEPEAPGERIELTMAPDRLAPTMRRLHELASDALANHLRPDAEEQRQAEQKVVACGAYSSVLAQLSAARKEQH